MDLDTDTPILDNQNVEDSFFEQGARPEPPSFPVKTSGDGARKCRYGDVEWVLTTASTKLDWKKAMTYTDNLASLGIIYGDAAAAARGELERIHDCAMTVMTSEEEKTLLENDLYSDLVGWADKNDKEILSIASIILQNAIASRASRILDAFTEFACEGHDKIHRQFLAMNMDRVENFLLTRPKIELDNKLLKSLAENLIEKFKDSYKSSSKGASVSQELSRRSIDTCSFVAQKFFREDSAMEKAPASFLCDIPRTSEDDDKSMEQGGSLDGEDDADDDFDTNMIPQVTDVISVRRYVIPDACNPKREKILMGLIIVFFFGALADAADTTIPDSNVRCLFLALQTFFTIEEYESFFGVTLQEPNRSTPVPLTITAGYECGGESTTPDVDYTPKPTYMQETSGGDFKYALCTCFKWGGIKKLVKGTYSAKDKKQVLAPIIFIYHRYSGTNPELIKKLKTCSENFLARVKTGLLEPKISKLRKLMLQDLKDRLYNDIITPNPLPYFTDEDGSFMFLCGGWNTHGPSLANNATLLLALSGMSDLDIKKIMAGSIRGDQNFNSCKTLLYNVDLLIISNEDIPNKTKKGGGSSKQKKAESAQQEITTRASRKQAHDDLRKKAKADEEEWIMQNGTKQQQKKLLREKAQETAANRSKKLPQQAATAAAAAAAASSKKPPKQAAPVRETTTGVARRSAGGIFKQPLSAIETHKDSTTETRKDDDEYDVLRRMFIQIRRYGGLDWKEVMDRLKGRAAILVYLLTTFMAILFTVDVCLAKSLCHIIFCIVRHSEVLSCYGELTTLLDRHQKQRINILKAKLVYYGQTLVDKMDVEEQMGRPSADEPPEQRRKYYLGTLHEYLSPKMFFLKQQIYTKWNEGIESIIKGNFSGMPNEYVLFNFLYLISASAIIESDLFCNKKEFVDAFSVVDSHTSSTHMLVRQYLRVNPDTMEKIHVLFDNRQENWVKSFGEAPVKVFTEHSTMLNLIWKKAICGGIDMDTLPLLISELSLGELCDEHYNLSKMPINWRGISLNRKEAPTLKDATDRGLLLNKASLEQCFLPVFCNSISVFIQKNCSHSDGSILHSTKLHLKAFLDSNKFAGLNPLKVTFENLLNGIPSGPSLESRYLSEPLGEDLRKRIKDQDKDISEERRKLEETGTPLLVNPVPVQELAGGISKGGSRKKNKHNITKKYRTKTHKSRQTRRNKHKHNHVRTIKRRKSRRNNSN